MSPWQALASVANELVSLVSLRPTRRPTPRLRSQLFPDSARPGLHYTRLSVVNCARTYVSIARRVVPAPGELTRYRRGLSRSRRIYGCFRVGRLARTRTKVSRRHTLCGPTVASEKLSIEAIAITRLCCLAAMIFVAGIFLCVAKLPIHVVENCTCYYFFFFFTTLLVYYT